MPDGLRHRVLFPVWPKLVGSRFFIARTHLETELRKPENKGVSLAKGARFATPLFLCLVVVEVSDMLFVASQLFPGKEDDAGDVSER